MLIQTEEYEHHGVLVKVRSSLKGQHRAFCLCYACEKFKPDTPDNCSIAQVIYAICVKESLVLPVWECPEFEEGHG
jgi:hypothetical protein